MHIDDTSRQYVTAGGERRVTRCLLLRRSYRDENGKPRNETLANLSALPDNAIAALRLALKGATLVDAGSVFDVERSIPHGNAAAMHVMAEKLGLRSLLGPPSKDRDIAYALILSRAVRPKSKLSTVRWWNAGDTTLAADLGVAGAGTDEVYEAMDWLLAQKGKIEKKLAKRHLREGGIAMYDLSSSWVEGSHCELAAFGYSRDGKRGRAQIEYGLLTDPAGRPVGIDLFKGNTADAIAFKTAIGKVRKDFGLTELVFVGDRGMITKTRIEDLRKLEGAGWVTAQDRKSTRLNSSHSQTSYAVFCLTQNTSDSSQLATCTILKPANRPRFPSISSVPTNLSVSFTTLLLSDPRLTRRPSEIDILTCPP